MRLFEVLLPAHVHCKCTDGSSYIDVDHLDGAYSFGRTERGAIVHLSANAPLIPRPDDGSFDLLVEPKGSHAQI